MFREKNNDLKSTKLNTTQRKRKTRTQQPKKQMITKLLRTTTEKWHAFWSTYPHEHTADSYIL